MYAVHRINPSHVVFNCLGERDTLGEALAFAERLHDPLKQGVTITVEDTDSKVTCASLSTKRIVGTMLKQVWVGDFPVDCGSEKFDATTLVISLPLEQIHNLRDHDYSSDYVGQAYIKWDGPHEVDIVSSVCEYFGVSELTDITENHLRYVKLMALVYAQCEPTAPVVPAAASAAASVKPPAHRSRLAAFVRGIAAIDVEKVIADNTAAAKLRELVAQSRAVMTNITIRQVQPQLDSNEHEDETETHSCR